jgi:hypothetical protein
LFNQSKPITNFLCFLLFNDEIFIKKEKKELLQSTQEIHFEIDERTEISKMENTILLNGFNENEKMELQIQFEMSQDFEIWWNALVDLLNSLL